MKKTTKKINQRNKTHKDASPSFHVNFKKIIKDEKDLRKYKREF